MFNLIKRICRIDQVMEFQELTFQSIRSLKSTLLLSSWAAWSLRVSEAHHSFHVLVTSGTQVVPFALLGGTIDTSCVPETVPACSEENLRTNDASHRFQPSLGAGHEITHLPSNTNDKPDKMRQTSNDFKAMLGKAPASLH